MHKTRISAYESYKNLTSLDVELINVLGTIIGVLAIPLYFLVMLPSKIFRYRHALVLKKPRAHCPISRPIWRIEELRPGQVRELAGFQGTSKQVRFAASWVKFPRRRRSPKGIKRLTKRSTGRAKQRRAGELCRYRAKKSLAVLSG
jgi:hypothetical protein